MSFTDELITADIPDQVPASRVPVIPVTVSVSLHLLLGLVFLELGPGSGQQPAVPERSSITVTLRQIDQPEQAEQEEISALTETPEQVETVPSEDEATVIDPVETNTAAVSPAVPESGIETGPAGEGDDEGKLPYLDPGQINATVSSFVSGYRQGLTGDWLADCVRYEIEHGVQDCPQGQVQRTVQQQQIDRIFRTANGAFLNAMNTRKLQEDMDSMRPFLDEDSLVGELARQRYSYDRVAYEVLNGEAGVPGSGPQSGPVLTPIGSKLVLFTGFMSFDLANGKVKFFDDEIMNPPQAVLEIYDFSGADRPVNTNEEEGGFRIVPSLFPSARQ
jgi:hypothetical protein